jgi:3D-(3,5/4)-trihydroxycyclohexane-1,2-dione acylhydrolase (decyclizing)
VSELQASWAEVRGRALVPRPGEQMRAGEIIAVLNDAALPGDVIVTAAGAPPGDLLKIWDATGGRRCHIEFGFSCMGYEVPGGVGASLALPEAHVVVLVGDGSFLIAPGELATALQERLPVTVVVLDNHGYQVIRRLQVERGGRSYGNEFRLRRGRLALSVAGGGDVVDATPLLDGEVLPLDLVAIASGLGAEAVRVESLDALREALTAARQTSGPFVIVAEIDPYADLPPSGAWWDVAPAEVSHDLDVKLSRREYEDARSANQHFYGHG